MKCEKEEKVNTYLSLFPLSFTLFTLLLYYSFEDCKFILQFYFTLEKKGNKSYCVRVSLRSAIRPPPTTTAKEETSRYRLSLFLLTFEYEISWKQITEFSLSLFLLSILFCFNFLFSLLFLSLSSLSVYRLSRSFRYWYKGKLFLGLLLSNILVQTLLVQFYLSHNNLFHFIFALQRSRK